MNGKGLLLLVLENAESRRIDKPTNLPNTSKKKLRNYLHDINYLPGAIHLQER